MMDKDKLGELLEARAQAEEELEKLRTPVTILFSDIKGSTTYFEKKGDVEGMAMINRHNSLLFPEIEGAGGRVVKTIGDAIMACFEDPVAAIRGAVRMQRALEHDRQGRAETEQIHIRVGLHTGLGLIKKGDVYGDVVNAASRVQRQAQTEQILITDVLLDAARMAGFECAKMGRAELRGKEEPIDLYAVAWSSSATQQLLREMEVQYEQRIKELKREHTRLEEEFESARDQWRMERRSLNTEIAELEEVSENAKENARLRLSDELQSELRFQLEEAIRARHQAENDLTAAASKFEADQNSLKAQIARMQAGVVDAMERSNNPARMAIAVREQVEMRLSEAKQEWQLHWDAERKRLNAEIERLKKTGSASDEKKAAARQILLEKLGKRPQDSTITGPKTAAQWEKEFQEAKINWETEQHQLTLKIRKLEMELQRSQEGLRKEVFQEMHGQYEPQLAEANRDRSRLEGELQSLTRDLATERQRAKTRIRQLEKAIPEAQEAARKQAIAEIQDRYDAKFEEANRLRSRIERKHQDAEEEWESERRRLKKQIVALEDQLKEAKENAFKAQKSSSRTLSAE